MTHRHFYAIIITTLFRYIMLNTCDVYVYRNKRMSVPVYALVRVNSLPMRYVY